MRKVVIVLSFVFGFFLFSPQAVFASDGTDELWRDFVEILPMGEGKEAEDILSEVGPDAVFSTLLSSFGNAISPAASFFALVMGLAAISSLNEAVSLFDAQGQKGASALTSVILSATLLSGLKGVIDTVLGSLSELTVFFSGLIPILSGVLAAAGQTSGALTQALNMNITLGFLNFIQSELMLPLVSGMFVLSAVSGLDGGGVSRISKGIKNTFLFLSGIVTTVLVSALAMQSIITGAKDGAYLRAAKYAASGMIPVVGGTVSSALATLGGAVSVLRSSIGVGAVMAILTIILTPLVMLVLYRASLSAGILLCEAVGTSHSGARVFLAVRGALDALTGLYATGAVVSLLEVVIFLFSGVEVFG